MSHRYESSKTVGNIQCGKDNIHKLEINPKKRQDKKNRHHPERRRNSRRNRAFRDGYNFFSARVDKPFLSKEPDSESIVSSISKIFESKAARAELIQKIAALDGYKCEFSEQERLILVTRFKKIEDNLLQYDPDFSENPPTKWQERKDKNENLIDFVGREYKPWIGKNLLQAHIRKYDMPLYYAIANYKSKRSVDVLKELGVVSRKEINADLESGKNIIEDPEIKAAIRLRERLRMRRRRSQQPKLDR